MIYKAFIHNLLLLLNLLLYRGLVTHLHKHLVAKAAAHTHTLPVAQNTPREPTHRQTDRLTDKHKLRQAAADSVTCYIRYKTGKGNCCGCRPAFVFFFS